jgi:hypothetical protein
VHPVDGALWNAIRSTIRRRGRAGIPRNTKGEGMKTLCYGRHIHFR